MKKLNADKSWKCDVKTGKLCKFLEERIDSYSKSGKGMKRLFTVNKANREFYGIMYKTKEYDKGLMFNYCPFCGNIILNDKK